MSGNAQNIASRWGNIARSYPSMPNLDKEIIKGSLWENLVPAIGITPEQVLGIISKKFSEGDLTREHLKAVLRKDKPEKSEEQLREKLEKYSQLLAKIEPTPVEADPIPLNMTTSRIFMAEEPARELKREIKLFIRSLVVERDFEVIQIASDQWSWSLIDLTQRVAETLKRVAGLTDVLGKEQFKNEKHLEEARTLIQEYIFEYNAAFELVCASKTFRTRLSELKGLVVNMQSLVQKEISEKQTALKNLSNALAVETANLEKAMNNEWRFKMGWVGQHQPVVGRTEGNLIAVEINSFTHVVEGINSLLNEFMDLSVDSGRGLLGTLTGNRHLVSADNLFISEADVLESNKAANGQYDEITQRYQDIFNKFEWQMTAINNFKSKVDAFLDDKDQVTVNTVNRLIESFALLTTRMEGLIRAMPKQDKPFEVKKLDMNSKDKYSEAV